MIRRINPIAAEAAKSLIKKGKYPAKQISRLLSSIGPEFKIGERPISSMRNEMKMPPVKYSRRGITRPIKEEYKKAFRIMGKQEKIRKWNTLKSDYERIIGTMTALKSQKRKVPNKLLEELSEAQLQLEALEPLLPQEIRDKEMVKLTKGVIQAGLVRLREQGKKIYS